MAEIGPEHPIAYRQELVHPLFAKVQSRESCTIMGAASMGKSRLLQFLLRADVRAYYLPTTADKTILLWVDCNRMAEFTAWGLHELLLTALVESSNEEALPHALRLSLTEWRKEVIITQNGLLAQRYVELALQLLCKEGERQICFILDEFDEAYASLPAQALASLRALRDRYKYQISYLLFMRDHPKHLRDPAECEGFYELVSRSVLGLPPYSATDAYRVITQIVTRRGHEIATFAASTIDELFMLSGGHPGLLVALLDAISTRPPVETSWLQWATEQPKAQEECRKLWHGLRKAERDLLKQVDTGAQANDETWETLLQKGLLRQDGATPASPFFSPLFQHYVAAQTDDQAERLVVDRGAGLVWLNGKKVEGLTGKEYNLLAYLYENLGRICENEELITQLYPGDEAYNVNDNHIATLVGRLRKKLEPKPKQPRYLHNVRGRGYRLVDEPAYV